MTRVLVAEFDRADRFVEALRALDAEHCGPLDIMTPFPLPEAAALVGGKDPPLRVIMATAGFGMAALAYGVEIYSAVFNYPIDAGGRPLDSWPVFWLMPFEIEVFAAAFAGFVTLLIAGGLTRLHHAAFDLPGVERASQDRCIVIAPDDDNRRARGVLQDAGAGTITEWDA